MSTNKLLNRRVFGNNDINSYVPRQVFDIDTAETVTEFSLALESVMTTSLLDNTKAMFIGSIDDSVEIVSEGATDLCKDIVDFFKALLQKVKEWFGKMLAKIQLMLGDGETVIKKYGNNLVKDTGKTITGYTYTIDDKIPHMDTLSEVISNYNSEFMKVKEMTLSSIAAMRSDFVHDDNMDAIRGRILGVSAKIPSDSFNVVVKAAFRNVSVDETSISVDSRYLSDVVSSYSSIKESYKAAIKDKREIETMLVGIISFFNRLIPEIRQVEGEKVAVMKDLNVGSDRKISHDSEVHYSATTDLKKLNAYLSYKHTQCSKLSGIINKVMECKCIALKEQLSQYNRALSIAVSAKGDKI